LQFLPNLLGKDTSLPQLYLWGKGREIEKRKRGGRKGGVEGREIAPYPFLKVGAYVFYCSIILV